MIICVYCQSRVLETDRKCQACGSTSFRKISDKAEIYTGQNRKTPEKKPKAAVQEKVLAAASEVQRYSPRNRWVALVLCLTGGIFGLHRFYAGKVWTGILFLLTFGFLFVGPVVDGLTIFFGHFRDKDGLLLHS